MTDRDETSVERRAALARRVRRSAEDDRATGRHPAKKPDADPEPPTSPQNADTHHENRGKPPSPFGNRG